MEKNIAPEVFDQKQETYLQSYYKRLDERLGVTKDTSESLSSSFNQKLEQVARSKSKGSFGWKALSSAVAISLTLGMLITRLTMMPAGVATRGVEPENWFTKNQHLLGGTAQVITLPVDDPKGYSLKVVEAALAAEIEVTATRSGANYQVVLEGLIPRAAQQAEVKKLLKLKDDAFGNFNVNLTSSEK
jgi:hypothetical protein